MDYGKILEKSRENLSYMSEIRQQLHKNPGVGFDNEQAMEYVKKRLSELGIESKRVGKCGLSALIGSGSPCFLLRADTDGLAITEKTSLPYCSENGNMHACGHDIHTAQLLGAAKILKENEDNLCGCIKLMLQSAEENLCGARDMIENGILESPRPSGGMMIHVMTATDFDTGTIIVPPHGESAPAADFFRITINGKGCHGSSPKEGKDALYAACSTVINLSEISSRELAFSERAILTIGSLNAGDSANVIPDKAVLQGSMRCFTDETRGHLKKRLTEICEKTAELFGTRASIEFTSGCPSLVNDEAMCNLAYEALQGSLGDMAIKISDSNGCTTSGSEDFAYISREIPTVMLALAAGSKNDGHTHPLHHPCVTFDEAAMVNGCCALVSVAMHYLRSKR